MAAKSYKQLYEESKLTDEEVEALKIVARGCNMNTRLSGQSEYVDALVMVYKLIERLEV